MKIRTSDGMIFTVEDHLVEHCKVIRMIHEDVFDDEIIPLSNVDSATFICILNYAMHGKLPSDELLRFAYACNYLDYSDAMDAACKKIAEDLGQLPEWKKMSVMKQLFE